MTKDQKRVLGIAKKWQATLMLSHWGIGIAFDEPLAHTEARYRYSHMTITVFPGFFDQSRRGQETTIIHEMLHGVLDGLVSLVNEGRNGKIVTEGMLDLVEEQTVEHLTTVLAGMSGLLVGGRHAVAGQAVYEPRSVKKGARN